KVAALGGCPALCGVDGFVPKHPRRNRIEMPEPQESGDADDADQQEKLFADHKDLLNMLVLRHVQIGSNAKNDNRSEQELTNLLLTFSKPVFGTLNTYHY